MSNAEAPPGSCMMIGGNTPLMDSYSPTLSLLSSSLLLFTSLSLSLCPVVVGASGLCLSFFFVLFDYACLATLFHSFLHIAQAVNLPNRYHIGSPALTHCRSLSALTQLYRLKETVLGCQSNIGLFCSNGWDCSIILTDRLLCPHISPVCSAAHAQHASRPLPPCRGPLLD